jgi:hypothetical protein
MVMAVGLTQLPILTRKANGVIVRFYCGDFKKQPSKSEHCLESLRRYNQKIINDNMRTLLCKRLNKRPWTDCKAPMEGIMYRLYDFVSSKN